MPTRKEPTPRRKATPREKTVPAADGRGSPGAVEKRRAARLFNEALLGHGPSAARDGRTERRRVRLLKELAAGVARGGKRELKPIDVLLRVQELLDMGEPLLSIRKACPKPRPIEASPEVIEIIRRIHRAYTFAPAAYRFVGLDAEALRKAGVVTDRGGPVSRRPRKARRAA